MSKWGPTVRKAVWGVSQRQGYMLIMWYPALFSTWS